MNVAQLRQRVQEWIKLSWQNGTLWYWLALLLLIPVWFNPHIKQPSNVSDTLFVIDVSESMNVPDVSYPRPSTPRLELAKAAVTAGMEHLPCGSRVSIGLFAGEEVVVLFEPLEVCGHFSSIEKVVANINTNMRWIGDSWLIRGIVYGIKEANKRELNLVFISDIDEMPHGHTHRIADLIANQGKINAAIWGVGGDTPLPVPKVDTKGNLLAYWTPEDAVTHGNYPNLVGYVKYKDENTEIPADAFSGVTEHLSAFNKRLLQEMGDGLKAPKILLEHPKDGLPLLDQQALIKKVNVDKDARYFFGILALILILIGWFWPQLKRQSTQ